MDSINLKYPSELQRRLQQLRLQEMLSYLGVDESRYLQKVPCEQIDKHLKNCATCTHTSACDYCLSDWATVCEMKFCSNFQSLVKYRRRLMDEI
jgi:hypothetical protein